MNTILSFMDKLYSDSKTLSIVYIVGAVLLFVFIIMLIISLRKPKDEPKIIEEPKIDDNQTNKQEIKETIEFTEQETIENEIIEENKEELKELSEQSIFEKTVIIPLDELNKNETIEKALNVAEEKNEEAKEAEEEKVDIPKISSEIPNIDEFVDNVVKKTYEKNEQFSSVFVGNETSTIKLDKVMESLNVDEKVLENIVPEEEKTPIKESKIEENEEKLEETIETTKNNSLDALKKALDEKKQEISLKQDDLKFIELINNHTIENITFYKYPPFLTDSICFSDSHISNSR